MQRQMNMDIYVNPLDATNPRKPPLSANPYKFRAIFACSLCFMFFGFFLLIVGAILTATNSSFTDKNSTNVAGPVVLAIAILFIFIAIILCCMAKRAYVVYKRYYVGQNNVNIFPNVGKNFRNRLSSSDRNSSECSDPHSPNSLNKFDGNSFDCAKAHHILNSVTVDQPTSHFWSSNTTSHCTSDVGVSTTCVQSDSSCDMSCDN
ncbi:uncharacterized protein LOC111622397 [Centruroides sculpturatus]|uniref:uncharacterized protein LOC111622397 n=1 Tax=Centruroides sculpturatus TaxID=218467 RepID=UPI000C6EAABF|nr:uncharacterized protein LOC111622397 [Centruroides sculpturatus]